MINKLEKVTRIVQDSKLNSISNIPLVITEEHHHLFPFLVNSGLKDTLLIHIDSHDDLEDEVLSKNITLQNYYKNLKINNFICPLVYLEIINEIIWISPFQKDSEIYLQYLDKKFLKIKEDSHGKIKWKNFIIKKNDGISLTTENDIKFGKQLKVKELKKNFGKYKKKIILDIDSDAYAKILYGHPDLLDLIEGLNPGYGIRDWKKRCNETFKILKSFPKPSFIGFTKSQGKEPYTPTNLVDEIQEKTIKKLYKLYN